MYQARELRRLGYQFVPGPSGLPSDLLLRQAADAQQGFQWKGQEDYDAVGDAVVAYVQGQLVALCGLEPLPLPAQNAGEGGATTVVYATPSFREQTAPLLVLICGAPPGGSVGVWGRKLCINASLHEGAMFDYIFRAKQLGWSVLVANPNSNEIAGLLVSGSECSHLHLQTMWNAYVAPAAASSVLVVAHSYGACATAHLLKCEANALERIQAIAFTDGWVNPPGNLLREVVPGVAASQGSASFLAEVAQLAPLACQPASEAVERRLAEVGRDFVSSQLPAGTPVAADRRGDGVPCVSAGHQEHPSTTHAATEVVFAFLQEGLKGRTATSNDELRERCRSAGC
mmetsp:Transcript_77196/g.196014  ORF Transcript_77196/g.196014 Transcript_77196/m.196014 type:complete len:343 (+) Transcript_77196:1-1029(+)